MNEAIMAHSTTPGANVYCGLHLMREDLPRGQRGGRNDIVSVLGLIADMDADTGKVGTLPLPPSYVVETSPGNTQPTFLLDKPVSPEVAARLAKALQKATGADFGTGDIAHVWRIAGTLNYPNAAKIARGRPPEPCAVKLIQPFTGIVYDEATLRAALPEVETAARTDGPTFSGRLDIVPLLERASDFARTLLAADGQLDRSAHAARVIEQLAYEGFSFAEVVSVCLDRPQLGDWIEYRSTDTLFIKDARRIWAKIVEPKRAEAAENDKAARDFLHANDNEPLSARPPSVIELPPHLDDPFELDVPGHRLSEVAHFIYSTSPSPNKSFAVMSAVSLLSVLYGRRFLTPDGLGLNTYVTLIAGSGFGKDRPLKALRQLAESIGCGHLIGPNDFASDSALEFILRHNPNILLPLDELGLLLTASGKGSENYARAKRKAVLELYSSANGTWVAKVRASDAGAKGNKKPKPPIQWPTLSFLGATTPSTFYAGLEDDAFRSGFVARLIVTHVENPPPRQRVRGFPEVPDTLAQNLKDDLAAVTGTILQETMMRDATVKPPYKETEWADDRAEARLEAIRDWALDIGMKDERISQIVNRAGDHTSKLATIRAISRYSAAPSVTVEDVEWAFGIVCQSIKTVEDGANRFMSGSPFEALCKAIVEAVRRCKDPRGLKNADLLRAAGVSQAEPRLYDAALSRLIDGTGDILNLGKSRGRGGRYVLATVTPKAEAA
jgi:hypothetical protein